MEKVARGWGQDSALVSDGGECGTGEIDESGRNISEQIPGRRSE